MPGGPNGGATDLVVRTIESAKTSVRVAAYSFTSKPIAQALLADARRGIDVRVVVDKSNATARYTASAMIGGQPREWHVLPIRHPARQTIDITAIARLLRRM